MTQALLALMQGVLGTHQEFGYLNGTAGSRVQPYWALLGMNPLEDCQDASSWSVHWITNCISNALT